MVNLLEGVTPFKEQDAEKYNRLRWWSGLPLGDLLDRAADIHPEKEAFVDKQTRLSYQDARDLSDRLALGLIKLGINPLDRVLLQLPNWNEFVFSYFALQKIGTIPVLLIERYRQFEINRLIELTGASAWIVPSKYKKSDYLPIISDIQTEHPQVVSVAVVPMPDADLGERACAYIQPEEGAKLTFDEIISYLKSQKASVLQLPERIEFIDQMPHTAAQKLDKKALMADIKKKLVPEN
jgi:non-ribosomal peptide synthetase component E (peptide arylation enzyme)